MTKILVLMISILALQISAANAAAEIYFNDTTALTPEAKQAITNYLAKNCNGKTLEIREISSRKYSAALDPEDMYDFTIYSSFSVRYFFDGSHPITTSLDTAVYEELNNGSDWEARVQSFKGIDDVCKNI